MTRKIRWLTALGLVLAVGAVTARAEEEEAPPSHRSAPELLPTPLPVTANPAGRPLVWPSDEPGVWHFSSVPIPCPLAPAVFAPVGDGCACPVCPCGAACPCPACPLCSVCPYSVCPAHPPAEYVVEMKMVKAGDDEPQATAYPRVSVVENQTACVQTSAGGSKGQSSLQMQATVSKLDKGALLDLCVVQTGTSTPGNNVLQSHTETTEHRLPVAIGKATKLELTHDADGACTAWVEVTVTEVEREAMVEKVGCRCTPKAAEEEEEPQDQGLNSAVEILQGLFDLGADAAYGLSGAQPCTTPAEEYEPCQATPCQRAETAVYQGSAPTCTQCVAVESVKKPAIRVSVDSSQDRKCVEVHCGAQHFSATADHVVLHDDCIMMDGDVHCESSSDGCCETVIKVDHLMLDCKDGVATVRLDD